jgi:hypothetical protein
MNTTRRAHLFNLALGFLVLHNESKANPPRSPMEELAFWNLVERARAAAGKTINARPAALARELSALNFADLAAFQKRYESYLLLANSWELWGAAYLMNGGSSDDGFKYFRDWLISEGRDTYMKAIADPDSLSTAASQEYFELEAFGYAALKVYKMKGGGELERDFNVELAAPTGKEWIESALPTMFPKLAARFNHK